MSAREFWHTTPRKLAALASVHAEMHTPKKGRKTPTTVDGVPVGGKPRIPNSKSNGVGAPNAFIDQIM